MKGKKEINVPYNMSQKDLKRGIDGLKRLLEDCDNSEGKKTIKGFIDDYEEALERRRKFDIETDRESARAYYGRHREKCLETVRQGKAKNPEKMREYYRNRKEKERLKKC